MARTRVNGSNGVFGLGGARDTDVHLPQGAAGWAVYSDDDKLTQARGAATRAKINNINWFVWFSVDNVTQPYTVTFDAPTDGRSHTFYAFDGTSVQQVNPTPVSNKGNKARLQLTFTGGDPGVGAT